jgi:hypothetical protein
LHYVSKSFIANQPQIEVCFHIFDYLKNYLGNGENRPAALCSCPCKPTLNVTIQDLSNRKLYFLDYRHRQFRRNLFSKLGQIEATREGPKARLFGHEKWKPGMREVFASW